MKNKTQIIEEFLKRDRLIHPRWEDIKIRGYIQCSCGEILQTVEATREHWQMGHFDKKEDITNFISETIDEICKGLKMEKKYPSNAKYPLNNESEGFNQAVQELNKKLEELKK